MKNWKQYDLGLNMQLLKTGLMWEDWAKYTITENGLIVGRWWMKSLIIKLDGRRLFNSLDIIIENGNNYENGVKHVITENGTCWLNTDWLMMITLTIKD